MYARPFIDSLDFARNGNVINGSVPVEELHRLVDALNDRQGSMQFAVRGSVNKQGGALLRVSAQVDLHLLCQRCLEKMVLPVVIDTQLLLCSQAELDLLEDEGDEVDCILADTNLDVIALLEEEILLTLPIAPRHEAGQCEAAQNDKLAAGKNPFAVLAGLKVVK